jgi:NADH-quinone oxidoreductase subunit J
MIAAGFYALIAWLVLSVWLALRARSGGASTFWSLFIFISIALIIIFYFWDLTQIKSLLFYLFSTLALLCAFYVITSVNPVHSACWLVGSLLNVAFLFVLLEAEFVAAVQVLIYAGAIVVMYLFMVMMIDFHRTLDLALTRLPVPVVVALVILLCAEIWYLLARGSAGFVSRPEAQPAGPGDVEAIGTAMFTSYALPFEVISLALLAALVGAVLIGKRKYGEQ